MGLPREFSSAPGQLIIYYLSFQNITFLINLMGELVYLLHNSVKQPPISFNFYNLIILTETAMDKVKQ